MPTIADPNEILSRLREEMRVTERYAYFDHAAVAPLPRVAAEAIKDYATEAFENGDALWLNWAAKLEQTRQSAADLLSVDPSAIALLGNTTQGINLVAEGIPWRDGDNMLVPSNEFPSNLLPWHNMSRLGVEVRELDVPNSGVVSAELFAPHIDGRTRLIALSWVGFASGFRADVESIVDLAHSSDVLVLLDAIQGLGAFPLNAADSRVDFVCADGHKWMLGPEGAGILYIRPDRWDMLQPVGLGWNSLACGAFDPGPSVLKASAGRYEGGTTNMPGMHGLGASLKLLLDCGLNASEQPISKAILNNIGLLEECLQLAGFTVLVPSQAEARSGILGVCWPEATQNPRLLRAARKSLLDQQIVTSVRSERLRISTHAYNNEDEIRRLVDVLSHFRSHGPS